MNQEPLTLAFNWMSTLVSKILGSGVTIDNIGGKGLERDPRSKKAIENFK